MPFNPSPQLVYADGPSITPTQPNKRDIRQIWYQTEQAINAYSTGAGSIAKETRTELASDLAHAADVMAWVYNDGSNNGIYRKLGPSGSGSWARILLLPYSLIFANDAGSDTPNAIQATTSIPVASGSLVWFQVADTNSGSPVTIQFNTNLPLTIKTVSGDDVEPGGLQSGSAVIGIVLDGIFRLFSDEAIARSLYAARDAALGAQAAAEDARDIALAAAGDTVAQGFVPIFDSPTTAATYNLSAFATVTVNRAAAGAAIAAHRYSKVAQPANTAPSIGPKFQSADGAWWGLDEKTVRPQFFGVTGAGDDTSVIQAALNFVMYFGLEIDLDGTWFVSTLAWGNGANPFNIVGRAFIVGVAASAQPSILVFEGDRFTLSGHIKVDGQRSSNYPYGWWAKGSPNFQYVNLANLSSDRCQAAFRIGNLDDPDAVISEIIVSGGSTYSCPIVGVIEGTETYVTLIGGMKPAEANSGDTAWASRVKRGLIVKGAFVKVSGGELIQASSAATTDFLIDLQPANAGDGTLTWGEVELDNVYIETAGPLAIIHNPDGLTGAVTSRGLFRVSGCSGYHSQNNADFIQVAAGSGFTGRIVEGGNAFRCPVVRTFQNVNCYDNQCDVYTSVVGFGVNFKPWYNGVTGGFTHGSSEDNGSGVYTPTVTPGSGALTTVSAAAQYRKISGFVFVTINITITTNGTGAGNIKVNLPIAPITTASFVLSGRANAVSGKQLQGYINGASEVIITNYDNSYPGGSGENLRISGWYQTY